MVEQALGLIEVIGLIPAVVGADSGLKAANVKLLGLTKVGANIVTVALVGDVGAIKAAVEAGGEAASRVGTLRTTHVIARLQPAVAALFLAEPIAKQEEKPKEAPKSASKTGQQKVVDFMKSLPPVNPKPEKMPVSSPLPATPPALVAQVADEELVPPLSPLDNQLEEQVVTETNHLLEQNTDKKGKSTRKSTPKNNK